MAMISSKKSTKKSTILYILSKDSNPFFPPMLMFTDSYHFNN